MVKPQVGQLNREVVRCPGSEPGLPTGRLVTGSASCNAGFRGRPRFRLLSTCLLLPVLIVLNAIGADLVPGIVVFGAGQGVAMLAPEELLLGGEADMAPGDQFTPEQQRAYAFVFEAIHEVTGSGINV